MTYGCMSDDPACARARNSASVAVVGIANISTVLAYLSATCRWVISCISAPIRNLRPKSCCP